MRPKPERKRDVGSGTLVVAKFRSPVVVPAVVRVIATPVVSEYGVTAGVYAPDAEPENVGPDSPASAASRFAPLKDRAVLLVPPQARPVTVPLPPEFVPPMVNAKFCAPRKSVSLA